MTRLTRHIPAPPASVYRALVDPDAVARWMVPEGMTSDVHTFDPRPGGEFRITLTYEASSGIGKTSAHSDTYHGRFLSLIPNEKVVQVMEFETTDPSMMGEMQVTFTLTGAETGTDLSAVHENVPPGVSEEDNTVGWGMALDKLAAMLAETTTAEIRGAAYPDLPNPYVDDLHGKA